MISAFSALNASKSMSISCHSDSPPPKGVLSVTVRRHSANEKIFSRCGLVSQVLVFIRVGYRGRGVASGVSGTNIKGVSDAVLPAKTHAVTSHQGGVTVSSRGTAGESHDTRGSFIRRPGNLKDSALVDSLRQHVRNHGRFNVTTTATTAVL